jgi:hypothetical protein
MYVYVYGYMWIYMWIYVDIYMYVYVCVCDKICMYMMYVYDVICWMNTIFGRCDEHDNGFKTKLMRPSRLNVVTASVITRTRSGGLLFSKTCPLPSQCDVTQ